MTHPHDGVVPLAGSFLALLADSVFSHLVIGTLTVLFWRGLWEYLNRNLFPDDPELSAWTCFAVGNVGLVTLALSQNLWKTYVATNDTGSLRWLLGYHLYTYLLGVLNVFHWRGIWSLLDYYSGINAFSCLVSLAIGQGVMWLFRCSKCTIAPPLVVEMDDSPDFFVHSGRFHQEFRASIGCVIDSIFTVVVLHHATVFYWRGFWELFDLYLYPEDPKASATFTFLISFVLHAIVCLLQPIFNSLYRRSEKTNHPKAWQSLLETIIYFVGNPVCVTQWRGVWQLCTAYADDEHHDLIDLTTHFVGIGVLMLLMCGHSVTTRGCPIDGDSPKEEGCIFQNKYFRYWLERRDSAEHLKSQEHPLRHQDENQSSHKALENQNQGKQYTRANKEPPKQQQLRCHHQSAIINGDSKTDNIPVKVSESVAPIILQITSL